MAHASLDKRPSARKPESTGRPRAAVLLPLPFPGPFDYAVPPTLADLQPGDIVSVPLGRRTETGVVWDQAPTLPPEFMPPPMKPVSDGRLKPVIARLDQPPLPAALRRFVDWVAAYTLSPPGLVLAMALRTATTAPTAPATCWAIATPPTDLRDTPARRRVLDIASSDGPLPAAELARRAGVRTGVVRGLADAGALRAVVLRPPPPFAAPDPTYCPPTLGDGQGEAARSLRTLAGAGGFSVTLLEGVTGSGKTEIYLEAIAACLERGRQVLVLLPEIALSAQWTGRFARRFGTEPALWHSDLGPRLRRVTWHAVAEGSARVVVGARSALFLPFAELGLIIVDEEHESAFKQEDGVTYHARDMAVVRARLDHAPIILVSATPSLETLANVGAGRYRHLALTARHGGAAMPDVRTIDMRAHPPERGLFLSPVLTEAIQATMARGEQAMLFLNRRGYAPLTLCRTCGHRLQCPNCTAWLVEHRARRVITCHHCGYQEPTPPTCPSCHAEASLTPIGPGVERITEEARATFPDARLLVMASDTLPGPAATADAVARIARREVDLVIGTQIVAKGWHFPHLTLVGVVDADLGLGGGDLRAAERTVQLLHQVAGRAGRAEAPGTVLLQSYCAEHPVMQALVSGDFASFMHQEAEQRRPGFWPPFGRLAALIVSADTPEAADATARALGATAPRGDGMQVLGPAPAPLAILRGRHRRRLLLRARREIALQPIVRQWLERVTPERGARIDVDIDPVSFL
ncbi:primosome assembly protein PriA [Gluconacetobacter sacchari DSM 12717]|uniref:Replication restart protein PriA n=2 Tax=Gluconacetobacter sacchari TaxID=92759 RepID=A0A7W4ICF3_9PROT|nr:primosomal protein N' [Gluconacetobacter sacchari]MBB2160298.1 primosomal protein N' [Gluconacetobacter sacchari]GBQ27708.1 primosome assembly protein PriA [Gluconacetobacter sacchari DSM 12717]